MNAVNKNPYVGIFWYDPGALTLFGVRKEELTPEHIESAARDGLPFIHFSSYNRDVWDQENFPGDFAILLAAASPGLSIDSSSLSAAGHGPFKKSLPPC